MWLVLAIGCRPPDPVALARTHLSDHSVAELETAPFAAEPLTKAQADAIRTLLYDAHLAELSDTHATALEAGEFRHGGATLRVWSTTRGEPGTDGRSLFLSLHGGGGAPPEVNDKQWTNQQTLYEPAEGVYVAPRAPTDTWNLWHQAHIDPLFDAVVEAMVALRGVDPDRVYLTGYSAGGDGVYQLAPRLADRFAAAAMMAGHPNETSPLGLRNLPFALHVGADDDGYDRNTAAATFGAELERLRSRDPGGYAHVLELHADKGHWMDKEDAVAIEWMAAHERVRWPERVVWKQDDVTHDRLYWLEMLDPSAQDRAEITASVDGQTVRVRSEVGGVRVLLSDALLDLDAPITVLHNDTEVFSGVVPRTVATLARTTSNGPLGLAASAEIEAHQAGVSTHSP